MPVDQVSTGDVNQDLAGVEVASQKQDIVRRLASADVATNGGFIAELTNNPFFTAVRFPSLRTCL